MASYKRPVLAQGLELEGLGQQHAASYKRPVFAPAATPESHPPATAEVQRRLRRAGVVVEEEGWAAPLNNGSQVRAAPL